jgi:UDPglucose 6-dehydrogenase
VRKNGIAGIGMVGTALKNWFQKQDCELYLYDKYKKIGSIEELNKADYIYLCVPTPTTKDGCDISALDEVLSQLEGEKAVIIKSTVVPGTTDKLQFKYPQHTLLFSPEFLTVETPDKDMENPDRNVVGYTEAERFIAQEVIDQLPPAPVNIITKAFVAEFIKYAANTYLAMKVAKNNELYDIFRKFGGTDEDFEQLAQGIGSDTRIGHSHLKIWHDEYRGYGGYCLPKDTKAFIKFAETLGVKTPVTSAFNRYNDKLLRSFNRKIIDGTRK